MNDPGLEEPIERAAQNVESKAYISDDHDDDRVNDDPNEFLDPSRWWFTSTAIPLIAACFGPIASAFNICALASHWRVSIPSGLANDTSNAIDIIDPRWLLAVNGVSLALAIIANLALLLNMARRVPFKIAQPVTIFGWYISSFILIALIVAANYAPDMRLPVGVNRTLTQAYYYALWAAILYFVISSLMAFTVWGAFAGHYSMDFQLTVSQRTLMLQTTSYVVYLLSGAAIWHAIEGWSFSDAVYWANYTLLTIGLGDVTPSTNVGRGLIFPYAVGGIVILGLVIGSIRSLMLERGKQKFSARLAERTRERAVRQMLKYDGRVKLSPLEHWQSLDGDRTHVQKRRQEFEIMRRIQYQADLRRKWTALLVSGLAGLVLWFVGAVVFWRTEAVQGWTYFESLYFTYVSLLTIGYGDFAPQTNAGKSFYVFWSLLAVPTLTILISNMGDTVIQFVRDITLWLGELTILPGADGIRGRLKQLVSRSKKSPRNKKSQEGPDQDHNDPSTRDDPEKGPGKRHNKGKSSMEETERRGKAVERDELEDAKAAWLRGDRPSQDVHIYRFLLIREIRHVMRDIGTTPPKTYSYDEWRYFLSLLGESEDDEEYHRDPQSPEDVRSNAAGRQDVGRNHNVVKWSWLGERSPLLGDEDEPEWVLERLTIRLEEELRNASHKESREGAAAE